MVVSANDNVNEGRGVSSKSPFLARGHQGSHEQGNGPDLIPDILKTWQLTLKLDNDHTWPPPAQVAGPGHLEGLVQRRHPPAQQEALGQGQLDQQQLGHGRRKSVCQQQEVRAEEHWIRSRPQAGHVHSAQERWTGNITVWISQNLMSCVKFWQYTFKILNKKDWCWTTLGSHSVRFVVQH